jgi:hypothetical protein
MLKKTASIAALVLALATTLPAFAATGFAPQSGFELPEGIWLNGIVQGQNWTYKYGLVATGTSQATSTQLPANIFLQEVDTSTASTGLGVALPPCIQGVAMILNNNTANTITVYPSIANNPTIAAQDVIDVGSQASSTTITTYASKIFACIQNGVWTVK